MNEVKDKVVEFSEGIRRKQRKQMIEDMRLQQGQLQHPLSSVVLEKYWDIEHQDLWKYMPEIEVTLSEQMKELQGDEEEQEMLVNDLFYLLMEQSQFHMPRRAKFIRNGSPLVASLVCMVSVEIMPDQLSYWLHFMADEDKEIAYLGILGDAKHAMAWANHPVLKTHLLNDFPRSEAAAKGVKELVGHRRVHPRFLKTQQGVTLQQQLCLLLQGQLQSMQESGQAGLRVEHMETAIWVLSKNWEEPESKDLFYLFNQAVCCRHLLSTIFIIWACEALKQTPDILSTPSLQILIKVIESDMNEISLTTKSKSECLHLLADVLLQRTTHQTTIQQGTN